MSEYGKNNNHAVYYTGKYWNDYPECLSIINTRLFGKDIDWKDYLINQGLKNFEYALILNCGNGWVERELYDCGIIGKATGVEYSLNLVEECNLQKKNRNLNYICHDINTVKFEENTFDVVINFAAGHHIRYIEQVWVNIQKWLKPDGKFIHNDYIGPQRNQYSKRQWTEMNLTNNNLNIAIKKQLGYPDVIQMMKDDPTEAINSDKIIPLTYDIFNVVYHTKSGGAIAYELLTHNNNLFNFTSSQRKEVVKYIMGEDLKYMNKTGESFFHFIIAENNKSIQEIQPILDKHLNNMNIREKIADYTYGHYSYNDLVLNETIYCNNGNDYGKSMFVYGFSNIEPTGRWSIGEYSIIRFKINGEVINKDNKILLAVNSLPDINQEINIEINELETKQMFIKGYAIIEIPICINPDYSNEVILIFRYKNVKTPKELNINDDSRKLALYFKWMKLV